MNPKNKLIGMITGCVFAVFVIVVINLVEVLKKGECFKKHEFYALTKSKYTLSHKSVYTTPYLIS